jgi:Arc/MetJ-type ribon-helix-helix transcriptional regulator
MSITELLQRQKRVEELRREIQKWIDSGESSPLNTEEIKAQGRKRFVDQV